MECAIKTEPSSLEISLLISLSGQKWNLKPIVLTKMTVKKKYTCCLYTELATVVESNASNKWIHPWLCLRKKYTQQHQFVQWVQQQIIAVEHWNSLTVGKKTSLFVKRMTLIVGVLLGLGNQTFLIHPMTTNYSQYIRFHLSGETTQYPSQL